MKGSYVTRISLFLTGSQLSFPFVMTQFCFVHSMQRADFPRSIVLFVNSLAYHNLYGLSRARTFPFKTGKVWESIGRSEMNNQRRGTSGSLRNLSCSEGRSICARCQRPSTVCICKYLPSIPIQTETRILIVQHAKESKRRCANN